MCPKGLSLAQTCVLRITRIYTSWHCFSTHSFGWCKHVLILKGWKSVFFHFYLFQWMTPPWNQFLKLRIQLSLLTTPSPPSWHPYITLSCHLCLTDIFYIHSHSFITMDIIDSFRTLSSSFTAARILQWIPNSSL